MERRGNKGYRNQRYVDVNKVYQKHQIHQGQTKLQQSLKSPGFDDIIQIDLKLRHRARIIGERGIILNELSAQSGCKIDVPKPTDKSSPVKVIGGVAQVLKACGIICVLCKEKQSNIEATVIFKQSFIQSNFKTAEDSQKKRVLSDVELRVRGFAEIDFQLGSSILFAPKDNAGLFRTTVLQKPQDLEFTPEELQELSLQSNSLIWCDEDVFTATDLVLKKAEQPTSLQNVYIVSTTFEDAAKGADMVRNLIRSKSPSSTLWTPLDCSKYLVNQSQINNNTNNNITSPPQYEHKIVSSYSYLSKKKLQIPAKIRLYKACNLPLNVDIVSHITDSIGVDGSWPLTPKLLALFDLEYDVAMETIEEISNTAPDFSSLEPQQKTTVMATCFAIQFLRQAKMLQLEHKSYFEVDTQRVEFVVNRALAWLASVHIKDDALDTLTKKASALLDSVIGSKPSKSIEPTLISLLHAPYPIFSTVLASNSSLTRQANDNTDITFLSYRNNFESIVLTPYRDSRWAMEVYRYGNMIILFPAQSRSENSWPQFDGYPTPIHFCTLCSLTNLLACLNISVVMKASSQYITPLGSWFSLRLATTMDFATKDTFLFPDDINTTPSFEPVHQDSQYQLRDLHMQNFNPSITDTIELKTTTQKPSEESFRGQYLLRLWAQSWLAGIPTIAVGIRQNKVINNLSLLSTEDLPKMANGWDPNVCVQFASEVLDFLKKDVVEDRALYSLQFNSPSLQVVLEKKTGTPSWIPSWFLERTQ